LPSLTNFRSKAQFPFVLCLTLSYTIAAFAQASETVGLADDHQSGTPQAQAPAASKTSPATTDLLGDGNFVQRLGRFYAKDWAGTLPAAPAAARRGIDPPLDSPPFPNGDWGYNASPVIGAPDGNVYPLMTALHRENARTKVYGWIDPSINFSTSSTNNYPLAYAVYPNRLELSQAVVYVERLPNTVQNTHFDVGYHFTALYGIDYRFTTSMGYLSYQLLDKNRQNGFDPVLEYVDLYFPVKEGLNVRVGRLLSVPGIEAQLAPNNYNYTHSILYATDPFTATGLVATLKISNQWLVQGGLSAGHDIAPWSAGAKPSATGCIDYDTQSNRDSFLLCADGINDGKYAFNNVQFYDGVWYHKFNAKWHMASESWIMYQRDVPNASSDAINPLPTVPGANGAFCTGRVASCFAPEWAMLNYLNREINAKLLVGFRSDFVNDKKGQRTGVATKYTDLRFVSTTPGTGQAMTMAPGSASSSSERISSTTSEPCLRTRLLGSMGVRVASKRMCDAKD
jgi:hypothetical protein